MAFSVDVRSEELALHRLYGNAYSFDWKTNRLPYDKMAMMAMIALKHHLGDSVIIDSKGRWNIEWGAGFAVPEYLSKSAVGTYQYVFPERAPVQNILNREGGGA